MIKLPVRGAFALGVLVSLGFIACGGSGSDDEPAGTGAGGAAAGGAGAGGSNAGTGGAQTAGKGGGTAAGAAGSTGGKGGQAGAGAGGAAGNAGSSGKGGGAAGAAGAAGSAGGATSCASDAECAAALGATVPTDCASATCDPTSKKCVFKAKDKDGDGHTASKCVSKGGVSVLLGDDCDDTDKLTFPGSWDGPAGDGKPNRCGDGVDQDCSGTADDGILANGTTCSCSPGDVQSCTTDSGGKPVTFPKLDAGGKPLGKCKLGSRTCGSDGKWSPCTGIVPPDPFEICNGGIDDDCDGKADMDDDVPPTNTVTWTYDGDTDGFADKTKPQIAQACQDKPPTSCSIPSCDPKKWRLGNFPAGDCDDANGSVNPAAQEICNDVDDDCNGVVDDDYATGASNWFFDYDGDNVGDIDTQPVKSCKQPKTVPAGCDAALATTPDSYCAGLPQEGSAPACPPAPCSPTMWKKNIPNTDCKDRPDQGGSGKGNKPQSVYPGATDLCNGLDYNCDGAANTGCGCAPVGSTQVCGAADKCNEGTQECAAGGFWGTCSGGQEKGKVDYCPDDDSDTFCDLTACLVGVCPGAYPDDGHKYRERTACTGFSQPGGKGTDCNDNDPDVNPGILAEICNGDGKDHNCNGNTNVAGQGDCDCKDGAAQSCAAPGLLYPAGVTPPAALAGVCTWGSQSCVLGKWSQCTGGQGASATELCNGDGKDYNCNGKSNLPNQGDCGCTGSQSQTCGVCGKGTQTCSNGQWGNCIGDDTQIEFCGDVDGDGVCNGVCGQMKCPGTYAGLRLRTSCANNGGTVDCADSDLTRHQGLQEFCGDGKDSNCDGANKDSDGYNVGTTCTAGTVHTYCESQGSYVCSSAGSTTTTCNAVPGTPSNVSVTTPNWNGSYDHNCDGVETKTSWPIDPGALSGDWPRNANAPCTSAATYEAICNLFSPGACKYNNFGLGTGTYSKWHRYGCGPSSPYSACGETVWYFRCYFNAADNTCHYASTTCANYGSTNCYSMPNQKQGCY